MKGLRTLTIIAVGFYAVTASDDWSYSGEHGPTEWSGLCRTGHRQSPVNIVTKNAIKIDAGALKFIRYDFAFVGKIANTGHSVQLSLDGVQIHLEGGSLSSTYILEQMHFHWPAEHTVDGNRNAAELHFVHFDNKYENTKIAAQYDNGIAVVATLFELSNEDNMDMTPILKATELVSKWGGKNTAMMRSKVIPYLFLPKDHTTYYHYEGSLTTPECQESVLWFILTEKLPISEQQLNVFKNVGINNGTLNFNYRPTQPIGERKVYHRLAGYSTATSLTYNLYNILLSCLLVKLLELLCVVSHT